jgi:O-antigen ligase
LGKGDTIIGEPVKSNGGIGGGRVEAARGAAGIMPPGLFACCEGGLDASALLLPILLALVPHGAAPLAAFAGLCAAGVVLAGTPRPLTGWRIPAALLGGVLAWGALSATWSIDPLRSLLLDLRLAGLFAAALALAAAAGRIDMPWRLALCLFAGTAIACVLTGWDLATAGGLSQYVSVRGFRPQRFNQFAVWLALLLLPATALLACRGPKVIAAAAASGMAATVFLLADSTAKAALVIGAVAALLLYWRRSAVARLLATAAVLAVLTAPLTLPQLAGLPHATDTATALFHKDSAAHRLLIWQFAGARIGERPVLGWGLDSSRAIPGGNREARPGQAWLPLHPHDAALQVWLELGAPGAVLFAMLLGLLWLRLGAAPWPRLYAAAAGGSLAGALAVALVGWGIWQEWWLGTLGLALFAMLVMARAATPIRRRHASPGADR